MSGKNLKLCFSLFLLLSVMVGMIPTFGASAVIGSVAGSTNATVGGQVLAPNTTLFSGDNLRVNDGAAVVAMGMGSRMVFGRDTVASFERAPGEVTVLLGQGYVSMFHPEAGMEMRVKAGELSIVAGKGYRTLGDVAMVNGAIVVSAKEGMLKVEGPERSVEVTKGKTIAIMQKSAGSPRPQDQTAAGHPITHPTTGQVIAVATLGGVGANVVMSVINLKRTNDVKTLVNTANATAAKADADAIAAISAATLANATADAARRAAIAANNAAVIACKTVSPSSTTCGSILTP